MTREGLFPRLICLAGGAAEQGKSTILLLLAGLMAASKQFRVLVVELEENGRLNRLRNKEIAAGTFNNQPLPYSIVYIQPDLFHAEIPAYAARYDLVFIEIPSATPLIQYADILLLSNLLIFPVYAVPANLQANEKALTLLHSIRKIKEEKGLALDLVGIFNKFRIGQSAEHYLELFHSLEFRLFSAWLNYSLVYQVEISSFHPVLQQTDTAEIAALQKEFMEIIRAPFPSR